MKNIIIALAAVFAFAGSANAFVGPADTTVALFGASAQIKFWDALAQDFMVAPLADQGLACAVASCTVVDDAVPGAVDGEINGIDVDQNRGTCCDGCTVNGVANQSVCIKYSDRASFFGPEAVATNVAIQTPRFGCNAVTRPVLAERCFIDEDGAGDGTNDFAEDCVLNCESITLGASDVNFEAFTQQTVGYQNGFGNEQGAAENAWEPADGFGPGGPYDTNLAVPELGGDPQVAEAFSTIVVPFAIYVNEDVLEQRCQASSNAIANSKFIPYFPHEQRCDDVMDCVAYYQCNEATGLCQDANGVDIAGAACGNIADCKVYGENPELGGNSTLAVNAAVAGDIVCESRKMESLSQLEMQLAFADDSFNNNILTWSDLGKGLSSRNIGRCLRHAGSGTHATFDFTVTRTYQFEDTTTPFQFWHYTSSSDLDDCIAENMFWIDAGGPANLEPLAIGYLDADKVLNSDLDGADPIALDGVQPLVENIQNGRYPFWAESVIYVRDGLAADIEDVRTRMENFSGNAATLATFGTELAETLRYWSTVGGMNVNRGLDVRNPIAQGSLVP